jgi:hypothetical protein
LFFAPRVPVFGFVPNVLPFPVSESYVLGLLVCVSGAVSCRVLSDGVHSLRYVSMCSDRIVWIVHVVRVVSCAFVFVCISTCAYPCCGPDRITLRYVSIVRSLCFRVVCSLCFRACSYGIAR